MLIALAGCSPAVHPTPVVSPRHADEILRTASHVKLPTPHHSFTVASIRTPADLRGLVGLRDKRTSIVAILGWAAELGLRTEATSGGELVAWAERMHRLRDRTAEARPGDLVVFSHVERDDFDLVGLTVARSGSVTEFICLAGGVVRRGFLDAARPTLRRDPAGAIVNTHLRFGSKQPATNTSQFAGELLVHVIAL